MRRRSAIHNIINNIEIKIFLLAFTLYMASAAISGFFSAEIEGVSHFTIIVLMRRIYYAVLLFLSLHYVKCKIFHNKAIYILMFGLFFWLTFELFATMIGLTLFSDSSIYREILLIALNYLIFFLTARLLILHDLVDKFLLITLFMLGSMLLAAYIINFDGFAFLNPTTLKSMFLAQGRYRYSFGLGHVNSLGRYCLFYITFFCIYKSCKKEGGGD